MRYLKKILADDEIEQVSTSSDPDETLWSLWACKEAAFKVMKKIAGDPAFVPRRWFVFLQPDRENGEGHDHPRNRQFTGVIQIPRLRDIPCLLYATSAYIHCVAADNPDALAQSVQAVNALPRKREYPESDASQFGRSCLAGRLENIFSGTAGSVEIRRAEEDGVLRPPAAYFNDAPAQVDVSLSHDGQWVAYALVCL